MVLLTDRPLEVEEDASVRADHVHLRDVLLAEQAPPSPEAIESYPRLASAIAGIASGATGWGDLAGLVRDAVRHWQIAAGRRTWASVSTCRRGNPGRRRSSGPTFGVTALDVARRASPDRRGPPVGARLA